jgi:hypothetical protein
MDSQTGQLAVLECNPRAISGLHLFEVAERLPAAIVGDSSTLIAPAMPIPRMLAPIMLCVGLPVAVRNATLKRWYDDWCRARDVLGVPGDKFPLLGGVADIASFARISLRERCSLRAASTRDIEWDGEPLPAA